MRNFVVWCERQGLAERTIRSYVRRVAEFDDWLAEHGGQEVRQATWRDVRRFAETRRNTHATRNGLRSALVAFYRACGRRDGGPSWAVPVPKRKPGVYRGFATKDEWERLLAAAETFGASEHAAVCALYYQGLRRQECATLRWDQMRDGVLRGVGKGDLEYEMPIHPGFAKALRSLTPDGPWVFPGRICGTHASPNTIWMWVLLAGERAALGRVTPHRLRHTAIAAVNDSVGLRTASVFARHRDIQTTMIYTRTQQAELVAGMAAL